MLFFLLQKSNTWHVIFDPILEFEVCYSCTCQIMLKSKYKYIIILTTNFTLANFVGVTMSKYKMMEKYNGWKLHQVINIYVDVKIIERERERKE